MYQKNIYKKLGDSNSFTYTLMRIRQADVCQWTIGDDRGRTVNYENQAERSTSSLAFVRNDPRTRRVEVRGETTRERESERGSRT